MTSDQPTLPGVAAARPLTPRQQAAYDHVRTHQGVTADQVGAHLHHRRGKHDASERCDFCKSEGRSVLTSKALKPLVTYRQGDGGRLYIPRDPADRPVEPDLGHIPF